MRFGRLPLDVNNELLGLRDAAGDLESEPALLLRSPPAETLELASTVSTCSMMTGLSLELES